MALGRSSAVLAVGCAVIALGTASNCGGDSFSSQRDKQHGGGSMTDGGSDGAGEGGGGAGSSGVSGTGGTSGTSNAGGKSGDGGRAGAGSGGTESGGQGDGGAAGEAPCSDESPCREGRYCDAQGTCRRCTDLTSLDEPGAARFGLPEPLTVLNEAAGDWFLRTPRAFGSGSALLYVRDFFGGEIWFTGNADRDVGAPLSSPINDPNFLEGSPLWLDRSDGPFASYNLIFNRGSATNAPSELYAAFIDASGVASNMMRLPAPFNPSQPLAESAYSMAVSRDRVWWMANRDLMFALQFLTAPIDQAGPPSVVNLRLSDACAVVEFDPSPWVSSDGRLLFISSVERNEDCSALTGEPKDILMFKLDDAGQPLGFGIPFSAVNRPGISELDASFSADMCTVYFSAIEADKLRLFKARRER